MCSTLMYSMLISPCFITSKNNYTPIIKDKMECTQRYLYFLQYQLFRSFIFSKDDKKLKVIQRKHYNLSKLPNFTTTPLYHTVLLTVV